MTETVSKDQAKKNFAEKGSSGKVIGAKLA